jgi:4-hydroxymandelate oxidase
MTDPLAEVVNLADFERLAAERLERSAFDYIAGGAGDELTLADNIASWRRFQLLPRVLRDVSVVDSSSAWLGTPVAAPFGVAPMAFQHFAHPDGELASARAAAQARIPFCLSTLSSRSIEEVGSAADDAADGGTPGPRWFQLYVHRDRGVSAEMVQRAAAAGYGAVVLTVDLPVAGRRERDLRTRLVYPQVFGNFAPRAAEAGVEGAPLAAVIGGFNDTSLNWSDIAWLRGLSTLPIVVKGVLAADDARLAVEHGAAGLIVSNHGGRQLDRAPAAIDVLPKVVDAAAGRAEVYVDGGIRRGVDVLTALALGAQGVFIGRPILYALAAGGEAGVSHALELLAAEVRNDMALLGVRSIVEIEHGHVRRAGLARPS